MSRRHKPRAPLPASCSDCRPYGGLWTMNENGGLERCHCERGQALADCAGFKYKRKKVFDGKAAAIGEK